MLSVWQAKDEKLIYCVSVKMQVIYGGLSVGGNILFVTQQHIFEQKGPFLYNELIRSNKMNHSISALENSEESIYSTPFDFTGLPTLNSKTFK